MADTVIHRSVANLRLIGIAEGISFLLLLGVGCLLYTSDAADE